MRKNSRLNALVLVFMLVLLAAWFPLEAQPDTVIARKYIARVEFWQDSSRYDSVVFYAEKAAALYKKASAWESYVHTLNTWGAAWFSLGKYPQAEQTLLKGLKAAQAHLNPTHPHFGILHNSLGSVCVYTDRYEEAFAHFHKALDIQLPVLGKDHPDVGNTYNSLGIVSLQTDQFRKALEYFHKSADIIIQTHTEQHPDVAAKYNNLGNAYRRMGDFAQALFYHHRSLEIKLATLGPVHPDVAISYYNLGIQYDDMGDWERALDHYQKALAIDLAVYGPAHPEVGMDYGLIALVERNRGNLDQSETLVRQALNIFLQAYGPESRRVAYMYDDLAILSRQRQAYQEAITYHLQSLTILKKVVGTAHSEVGRTLHNIGQNYMALEQFPEAADYFDQALQNKQLAYSKDHHEVARIYHSQGNLAHRTERYDQALSFFQQALRINLQQFGPVHPEVAMGYYRMGMVHAEKGQPDLALQTFQQGIAAIVPTTADHDIYSFPIPDKGIFPMILLDLFPAKGQVFYEQYQQSGNKQELEYALKAFTLTIELIDSMRISYRFADAKQVLFRQFESVFGSAIDVAYEMAQLTQQDTFLNLAFALAEKSKSYALREHLWQQEAVRFGGIPDSLQAQESHLRAELAFYQKNLAEVNPQAPGYDSLTVLTWQKRVFDLQHTYQQLISQWEQDYPDYFYLKYKTQDIDLTGIRTSIAQQQAALLEYAFSEDWIYAFCMTADTFFVQRMPLKPELATTIYAMRNGLDPKSAVQPGSARELYRHSRKLYDQLLQPVLPVLKGRVNRLTIVPEGVLAYVPFDLLAAPEPDSGLSRISYLLRDYTVSYAYMAMQHPASSVSRTHHKAFAGFAPQYPPQLATPGTSQTGLVSREMLTHLSHNQEEIQSAARYFDGETFVKDLATETRFKQDAHEYAILHLAMHALADDQQPLKSRLLFAQQPDSTDDGALYLWELYHMQLNADLAVLSACNTGYGKLAKGEGVMSLARAFTYAGCKSVLMSLWPADDEATAMIMDHFYQHLSEGVPKDEALRLAKLSYLDAADPLTAHPYFWSGMVATGDMQPIETGIRLSPWWILLGLGVVGVIIGSGRFANRLRKIS